MLTMRSQPGAAAGEPKTQVSSQTHITPVISQSLTDPSQLLSQGDWCSCHDGRDGALPLCQHWHLSRLEGADLRGGE